MKLLSVMGVAFSVLFLGISCENNTITFSGSRATDGGVYQSKDRGDTWEQKIFVSQEGKRVTTIAGVNVSRIIADPKDSRIVYLTARESGVWKTRDAGDRWAHVYEGGGVNAFSIHPSDTQVLYLAAGNTIQKSMDGGGGWSESYLEPRPGVGMASMFVDASDPRHVIAGTSAGDILESRDSGASWHVMYRFEFPVIVLLQSDITATYFAASPSQGIWRSTDAGKTWKDITESLKEFPGAREFRALILDPATEHALLLATAYGIFRTTDHGVNWETIPLISPPRGVEITAVAVNPKNSSHIYYTVPGALYRSSNGGARWTTVGLPSGKLPTAIAVDHFNPNILYMGFTKPK